MKSTRLLWLADRIPLFVAKRSVSNYSLTRRLRKHFFLLTSFNINSSIQSFQFSLNLWNFFHALNLTALCQISQLLRAKHFQEWKILCILHILLPDRPWITITTRIWAIHQLTIIHWRYKPVHIITTNIRRPWPLITGSPSVSSQPAPVWEPPVCHMASSSHMQFDGPVMNEGEPMGSYAEVPVICPVEQRYFPKISLMWMFQNFSRRVKTPTKILKCRLKSAGVKTIIKTNIGKTRSFVVIIANIWCVRPTSANSCFLSLCFQVIASITIHPIMVTKNNTYHELQRRCCCPWNKSTLPTTTIVTTISLHMPNSNHVLNLSNIHIIIPITIPRNQSGVNFQMTMSCISGVASVPPPYPRQPNVLPSMPLIPRNSVLDGHRRKQGKFLCMNKYYLQA